MNAPKIALVDYGAGNLPSVERALGKLGVETRRAGEPSALDGCDAIVLPGVGHFGALMRALAERRLLEPLRTGLGAGTPFLGICLGLQALFRSSQEDPARLGLGVFDGQVAKLPDTRKLPHMGWNQLQRIRRGILLEGVPEDAHFYFAHSYAAMDAGDAGVALCDHGAAFVAVAESRNLLGVQFHPEKSGEAGARVLRNFVDFVSETAKR